MAAADPGTMATIRRLLLALAICAAAAAPAATARSEGMEGAVLREINAIRAEHGAPLLRVSSRLMAVAAEHTREMLRDGYFAHESADGAPFWKRVQLRYPQGRYSYWSAGENLVWASPSLTPEQAVELWLDSPPHRRTMLDPKWREIGVSAAHEESAPGTYEGREVTVLTADFGLRR